MTFVLLLFLPGLLWGLLSWKFTLQNRWIRFWCLLLSVDLSIGLCSVLRAIWAWYLVLPCMILCAALVFFVCWQVLNLAFRKWADRPFSDKTFFLGFVCDFLFGILTSAFLWFLFFMTPLAKLAHPAAPKISAFTAGTLTAGTSLAGLTSDTIFFPTANKTRSSTIYPKQRFLSMYEFLIDRINGEQEKSEAAERAAQEAREEAKQEVKVKKKKKRRKNKSAGKEKSMSNSQKNKVKDTGDDADEP